MRPRDETDPKGLIYESYRIEGITEGECRSIFLDWALSMPDGREAKADIAALLGKYRDAHADHPMTRVLTEGLSSAERPRRRGGWRSRPRE